ncbi:WD40 repeat domain-containing protein, partial [bacterium]|nr:WD40 repeat domain-containing protein [bacterium]
TEPAGKVTDLRFLSDQVLLEARGGTLYARDLGGDRSKVTKLAAVHAEVPAAFAVGSGVVATNDGKRITLSRLTHPGTTPTPLGVVEGVTDEIVITLTPDGTLLALADGTGKLAFHETSTGKIARKLWWRKRPDGSVPTVGALAFLADEKTLVVGCADGLRLYDVETGRERGWVGTHSLRSLAVSGDGAFLAASAERGSAVYLWPVASLQPR